MGHVDLQAASHEHFARIHRAALVLCGNPWDADDLSQETFLVLSARAGAFRGESNLYTWLYGILLNLERRQRRRAAMQQRKLRVVWNLEATREALAPAADLPAEVAEWRNSLWAHVARLPDGQRQALVLRFSEHLSYEQIAAVLGCPLGTVKSRIFNGLAALREMLADENHPARQSPLQAPWGVEHAV